MSPIQSVTVRVCACDTDREKARELQQQVVGRRRVNDRVGRGALRLKMRLFRVIEVEVWPSEARDRADWADRRCVCVCVCVFVCVQTSLALRCPNDIGAV